MVPKGKHIILLSQSRGGSNHFMMTLHAQRGIISMNEKEVWPANHRRLTATQSQLKTSDIHDEHIVVWKACCGPGTVVGVPSLDAVKKYKGHQPTFVCLLRNPYLLFKSTKRLREVGCASSTAWNVDEKKLIQHYVSMLQYTSQFKSAGYSTWVVAHEHMLRDAYETVSPILTSLGFVRKREQWTNPSGLKYANMDVIKYPTYDPSRIVTLEQELDKLSKNLDDSIEMCEKIINKARKNTDDETLACFITYCDELHSQTRAHIETLT